MEVKLAKTAGFCFGVRNAVDLVYRQVEENPGKRIYTYGPIIHNQEVVKDLEQKGVTVLEGEDSLQQLEQGIVIIRSHGVGKHIYEILNQKEQVEIVDATCPFVRKIHRIVAEKSQEDGTVVIIGNEKHPEVMGIKGWGNSQTIVIENSDQIAKLEHSVTGKLYIVAQTTYNYNKFQVVVEKISKKGYDICVLNTICNATQERQIEAKQIAENVEAMLVVGDKHSSNTQKLYEICQDECKNTYYIQTLGDLNPEWVSSVRSIGITAGASTPNNIIEEVHTNVRIKF